MKKSLEKILIGSWIIATTFLGSSAAYLWAESAAEYNYNKIATLILGAITGFCIGTVISAGFIYSQENNQQ